MMGGSNLLYLFLLRRKYQLFFKLFLLSVAISSTNLYGQEKMDSLYSTLLNEKRFIQVFLPSSYNSKNKYDVLYVTDGEMLTRFVNPIRAFAEENELVPPLIIIGIKNNYWYSKNQDSRDRDLLPQKVDGSPLSGDADKFLSFLGQELIPYVNKHYATSGKNTLFGHSYGGLFTLYTLLTQPDLFNAYIASDPALWWNEGYVIKLAATKLAQLPESVKTLFIGGRSGKMHEAFGGKDMDSLLHLKAPTRLKWQSSVYADEHHGSVRLKSIYDGLKFTYFGYSSFMTDFFPMDGILLKDKPAPIWLYSTYLETNPGIRYTLDGTDPTPTSARYEYGTLINAPAQFRLKQFSNYGPDKLATGHFTVGAIFQASQLPKQATSGGLRYAFYESDAGSMPSFNKSKPTQQGRMGQDFTMNVYSPKTAFACQLDGYLEVQQIGYYTFFLGADYQAKLYIDNHLLIDIDLSHDPLSNRSFIVPLDQGFHSIRVDYLHKGGERMFSLSYLTPSSPETAHLAHLPIDIPVKFLYSQLK